MLHLHRERLTGFSKLPSPREHPRQVSVLVPFAPLTSTGGGRLRDSGRSRAGLPPRGSYRRCRGWWPCRSSGRLAPTSDSASLPLRTSGAPAMFGFAVNKEEGERENTQRLCSGLAWNRSRRMPQSVLHKWGKCGAYSPASVNPC